MTVIHFHEVMHLRSTMERCKACRRLIKLSANQNFSFDLIEGAVLAFDIIASHIM